ncbi:efflux RND transporter periplasmic adaptor subunit [Sulfuritalea sp.]|uniref:efflux RND transporter periplasmic adaptor subunit n=1 Tax=Sulfuritalea sp. TaxID=2480090 RepID=UPI00286D78BB|nr:efflux RND transporter periplasmic adaptor subunit [Sulfuritalea sp.]
MRNALLACLALALLSACGQKAEQKKAVPPPSLITVTQATKGDFEVVLETLGSLEVLADPKVGAEVAGRVTQVLARSGKAVKAGDLLAVIDAGDVALQNRADEAEARRVEALAKQQEKLAERQQMLMDKGFLSKNAGEDVAAQRAALSAQFDAARARADNSRRSVGKTRVISPIDGVVEVQIVSPGDYVKVGDPLFNLVAPKKLRAHLPFAESFGPRLQQGQEVRLVSPLAPGKVFASRIKDIRPGVVEGSRTLDVLVDVDNDGSLRGGGTVNAAVIVSAKAEALTVPEQSVVLRPAGKVVYVIAEADGQKKAQQKPVKVGAKRGGRIEILEGLAGGETIALDGAGFLTNGAAVAIKEAAKPAAALTPNPSPATGEGSVVSR